MLFSSVAVAAPVPKAIKKKLPDYYPLTAGSTWVYTMGQTEVTVKATEFEEKDGVRSAKLVTELGGKQVSDEVIRVDAGGVSRTHINGTKIDPPVVLLKFGLADEEEWPVKSKVGAAEVKGAFTLKGLEEVTVPGGKYEAVFVLGACDIAGTPTTTKWWIAEGVGIVKLSYSIGGSDSAPLELKKYTPGEPAKSK